MDLSNGPSWLYSTPVVNCEPFSCFNKHIAPHASPGFRWTVIELSSKFLSLLTPSSDGKALSESGFVS